jgi:hypothetical protein
MPTKPKPSAFRPTKGEENTICRLAGCIIAGVEVQQDGTTILKLDTPERTRLHAYVQADPEGNGPGHLNIFRNINGDAEYFGGIGGN